MLRRLVHGAAGPPLGGVLLSGRSHGASSAPVASPPPQGTPASPQTAWATARACPSGGQRQNRTPDPPRPPGLHRGPAGPQRTFSRGGSALCEAPWGTSFRGFYGYRGVPRSSREILSLPSSPPDSLPSTFLATGHPRVSRSRGPLTPGPSPRPRSAAGRVSPLLSSVSLGRVAPGAPRTPPPPARGAAAAAPDWDPREAAQLCPGRWTSRGRAQAHHRLLTPRTAVGGALRTIPGGSRGSEGDSVRCEGCSFCRRTAGRSGTVGAEPVRVRAAHFPAGLS